MIPRRGVMSVLNVYYFNYKPGEGNIRTFYVDNIFYKNIVFQYIVNPERKEG